MSNRFDNRTIDEFKAQIKFSTILESYFFNKWLDVCKDVKTISIENPRNNGVDNTGEFVENGKTSGADYLIDFKYEDTRIKNMPIEIKWVPTYGKLSLKEGDLKAYIREKAAILFIYPCKKLDIDLKIPKNYDLKTHLEKIESISEFIRWGVMTPEKVKFLLSDSTKKNLIRPIPYMGFKMGIVIEQKDFRKWFKEELWNGV